MATTADLISVWPKFAHWLLTEELPKQTANYPECTAALASVAALYQEWIATGIKPVLQEQWFTARRVAYGARGNHAANAACDAAAAAAQFGDAVAANSGYAFNAKETAIESVVYTVQPSRKTATRTAAAKVLDDKIAQLVAEKA